MFSYFSGWSKKRKNKYFRMNKPTKTFISFIFYFTPTRVFCVVLLFLETRVGIK